MMMKIRNILKLFIFTGFLLVNSAVFAQSSKFKVVLDAGHGGKDPGALQNGFYEKKIALNVALKVGEILKNEKNIEIIYTRKTDVFIELKERANIANKHDANLFVSLHCNSADNKSVTGTETLVMGMSRSDMNMDIAKRENAVIYLEDDYKENYKGFDPSKPETLMGLKILQEEYQGQSIELAGMVEKSFVGKLNRSSRGVKQQPIWVLDATVMPGVLIEMGFISNKTEGAYLNSEEGQNDMANAISEAILKYKSKFYTIDGSSNEVIEEVKPKENKPQPKEEPVKVEDKPIAKANSGEVIYKVQISASGKKLETKSSNFKGLSKISREKEGSLYKYFYSEETDYEACQKRLKEAKSKGYKSAFIVAYKDGVKINVAGAQK